MNSALISSVATVISTTSDTTGLPKDRVETVLSFLGICLCMYLFFEFVRLTGMLIIRLIKNLTKKGERKK